ncbi:MAG TPA: hypothetical protein PKI68_08650 [Pontiellaceae bacterium]|nr:hypothetical protein [Pontiellaceae bacterium]
MLELSTVAMIIGLLALTGGTVSVLAPAKIRAGVAAFPRSIWPGRILAAIDLVWAAYELAQMHLGMFDAWKVHLYWLTPAAIVLCVVYLDELLSPRALGGLLLLAAGPVLDIARWHSSNWRLVITVLAYLWILLGLVFLLSPWWFRRIALWVTGRGDTAVRVTGAIKAAAGLGLIALALLVY